jgi:hypothetical protein
MALSSKTIPSPNFIFRLLENYFLNMVTDQSQKGVEFLKFRLKHLLEHNPSNGNESPVEPHLPIYKKGDNCSSSSTRHAIGNTNYRIKRLNVKIGAPMSITTGDEETRESLQEPLATIISVIMRGLDKMIEEKTTLKVFIPEDPLLSIIKEAGVVLDSFSNMKKVCIS